MDYRCPHCQAPVYSRKSKVCGVCEQALPADLLLTENQLAILRKQDEQQEKRAKEFTLPDLAHDSGSGASAL